MEVVLEPMEKQVPWARSVLPARLSEPRPKQCLLLRDQIGNSIRSLVLGCTKYRTAMSRDLRIRSAATIN